MHLGTWCVVKNRGSCAQVYELLQGHWSDMTLCNLETWRAYCILRPSCLCEIWALCVSWMTYNYLYYIYICIDIYIYILYILYIYIYNFGVSLRFVLHKESEKYFDWKIECNGKKSMLLNDKFIFSWKARAFLWTYLKVKKLKQME